MGQFNLNTIDFKSVLQAHVTEDGSAERDNDEGSNRESYNRVSYAELVIDLRNLLQGMN